MNILCPHCRAETVLPVCHSCGLEIPTTDGVYQLTDEPNINMNPENGERYIGYDSIGEDFDPGAIYCSQWSTHYGVYKSCTQKLVNIFGKNSSVLDIGAGLGAASLPLAKTGVQVIAADISQNMLRLLHNRINKNSLQTLTCCRMNAYRLMIPDHSVDVVVENHMLHLVENPETVVREIIRVLKPSGALVRYNTCSLSGDPRQYKVNDYYLLAIRDITVYYFKLLKTYGYEEFHFDNHAEDSIRTFFQEPVRVPTNLQREFRQKMKLRIHRLRTKAHSGLQHVPDDIHQIVWRETEKYAISKYGEDYDEIPSYCQYTSTLDIYYQKIC